MTKQKLIIIDGQNGAGKSTVAKLVHQKLPNTALVSFDQVKLLISNFTPTQENIKTTDTVVRLMVKEYLRAGMNVIVEAFFPDSKFVKQYQKSIKGKNVKFYVFQLEADFKTRFKRINNRPLSVGAKKKMDKKWLERNDSSYADNKYNEASIIDTYKLKPQAVTNRIISKLR